MIFPIRTDVMATDDGEVVLSFFDHPNRHALEDVVLSPEQACQLAEVLVRMLYPEQADEALAVLP